MALPYDPDFTMAVVMGARAPVEDENDDDQEHDAAASAAIVAVDLLSSARLAAKLDSVYTEYSAQYLVDNARPKKKHGGKAHKKKHRGKASKKKHEGNALELTVKDCLEFALKNGIPRAEGWPQSGSLSKPPASYKPALVSMKGELIEAKNMLESDDLLWDQPVGAKVHVFSPHIDLQLDGIYCGSSGEDSRYVGLRDGIIVQVEKINGKSIATVKLWYKNQFRIVNVAMSRMFAHAKLKPDGSLDYSRGIEPTFLLIDFIVPRLLVN